MLYLKENLEQKSKLFKTIILVLDFSQCNSIYASVCVKWCGGLLEGPCSPLILALGAKITQIAIYLFGQPKPMQGIAYISGHIPFSSMSCTD